MALFECAYLRPIATAAAWLVSNDSVSTLFGNSSRGLIGEAEPEPQRNLGTAYQTCVSCVRRELAARDGLLVWRELGYGPKGSGRRTRCGWIRPC